jgi:hypothetical protein
MCRVARSWDDVPTGPTPAKQQIDLELACKHRERSLVPNSSTWGDEGHAGLGPFRIPESGGPAPFPSGPSALSSGRPLGSFSKSPKPTSAIHLQRTFSLCWRKAGEVLHLSARGSSASRPGRLGRSHRICDLAGSLFAGASAACGGMSLPTCQVFEGKARSVRICTTH